MLHCVKKNWIICNTVEGPCLLAMKLVHHHPNGCCDWLISEHRSVTYSFERSNFYTVWEVQKIYVCLSCLSKALLNYSYVLKMKDYLVSSVIP